MTKFKEIHIGVIKRIAPVLYTVIYVHHIYQYLCKTYIDSLYLHLIIYIFFHISFMYAGHQQNRSALCFCIKVNSN